MHEEFEIELTVEYLDKPADHCGVFGIFGHPAAAEMTFFGLQALQHRGQEASGIVSAETDPAAAKTRFHLYKDFGLVNDVFRDPTTYSVDLVGDAAIGHNRYSTAGAADNKTNIQPLVVNYRGGNIAISHNGNLTNFRTIRDRLQEEGTIFLSTSDTEVILHLIARSKETDQIRQVVDALNQVEGAYSLVLMTDDKLMAARDPHGWRPLAVGKVDGAFVVASETCAFDIIRAEYVCDVEPGELLVFDRASLEGGEVKSYKIAKAPTVPHRCIFEYIYFSRPDSRVFGESVDRVRRQLGRALAEEHPLKADNPYEEVIVINVPDSSNTATLGYVQGNSEQGNTTRFELGLIRSHYVGRTFIQPVQARRVEKVRTKFNTVKNVLKGKKVVIVDDSIVRGTTSRQLVRLVREAGAREIHFRVTSPPIRFPCHYGMDFPDRNELVANRCDGDLERIRQELEVDSIGYLSLERMIASAPQKAGSSYCTACFDGRYPTAVEESSDKDEFEA